MTPETEALIARVRELDAACSVEGNNIPILLGQIADLAPQLATALEAAEKRADAAEAKLTEAATQIDALADLLADSEDIQVKQTPAVKRLNEISATLTQLEP